MQVQVVDRLCAMLTIVDDHAIALLQAYFLGYLAAYKHQVTQQLGVAIFGKRKLRNWLARNDKEVSGCLWRNIIKCHTLY